MNQLFNADMIFGALFISVTVDGKMLKAIIQFTRCKFRRSPHWRY
jgi:hypothetical protein